MATMLGIAVLVVYGVFAVLAVRAVTRGAARARSTVPDKDDSSGPRATSGA